MTRKERVKKAIQHEHPDFVPYHIDFTISAHAIPGDVPVENMLALIEVAQNQ